MVSVSKLFFVLIVFVFAVPFFVSEAFAVDSKDVAVSAIEGAEAAVVSAYEAVLDAEQAGADVSGLLVGLDVAGEYLASAHIWYDLENFDNVTRFADRCYDVGEEVRNEAVELRNEAHGLWVTDLVVTMTGSMIGVIVVVFLSLVAWSAFKRRYQKRVLGLKPEVVSGES